MFIGPRNQAACRSEVEAVQDYSHRIFGIEVDYVAFKTQIREIIHNRINDYVFQRFRDWPIRDLIELEKVIDESIAASAVMPDPRNVRRRGQPKKIEPEAIDAPTV